MMHTYKTHDELKAAGTEQTPNSFRPPSGPWMWECEDCRKSFPDSQPYAISGKTSGFVCYGCAHKRDIAELLDRTKPFFCYVSGDGRTISNWPGSKLGDVSDYAEHRTGWHGSTQARFRVLDVHGQWWAGRGMGKGMCATIRPMKTPKR